MSADAEVSNQARAIPIYDVDGFVGMREAGRLAAACLDEISPLVVPGASTEAIDDRAREFIFDHGATPACIFYRGYPKTVCTSINHVICHGIPNAKPLRVGDIVNIDVTLIKDGWHGDTSRMYAIGPVKRLAKRLIDTTFECMWAGIKVVKPGATVGDIGAAIAEIAHRERFSVVEDFCGHGLGRSFHTAPNVVHIGAPGAGPVLETGMFFTIEPMINAGTPDTRLLKDGWTAVTRDKSLSAQFEHSIGVTEDGFEVFTGSPAGLDRPVFVDA